MDIHIVDSIMGSGKSTWAFSVMNDHPEKKYIYIAQFLTECDRVQSSCPGLHFYQPQQTPSKQIDFKRLASSGKNIVTTHSLLSQLVFSGEEYKQIQDQEYVFILDEVVETVRLFTELKKNEFNSLVKNGMITVSDDGYVRTCKQNNNDLSRYKDVFDFVSSGSVFRFEESFLLWTLPMDVLKLAKELFVLTFFFESSHLKKTLDMNQMAYDYSYIQNGVLIPGREPLADTKRRIRDCITIYDQDDLNSIGKARTALSATYWKGISKEDRKRITDNIRNYFSYKATGERMPARECVWTAYGETAKKDKNKKRITSVKDYDNSCISFNERATNQYSDRICLAYPVNVYEHPAIYKWFDSEGQPLNHDYFALSTMLQWIWRSAIRNGEHIYLYLPSSRMRKLLVDWLEDKDSGNTQNTVISLPLFML